MKISWPLIFADILLFLLCNSLIGLTVVGYFGWGYFANIVAAEFLGALLLFMAQQHQKPRDQKGTDKLLHG